MWRYVKIPKAVALLAFLLPWMTVSCSNQRAAEASGWEMVLGRLRLLIDIGQATPAPRINPFLAAAVALIVIGLVLSFLRRRYAGAVVGTSAGAMILVWYGAQAFANEIVIGASRKGGMNGVAASMIRIDWQIGYWIALIALAAAAMLAFLAIRDPDGG